VKAWRNLSLIAAEHRVDGVDESADVDGTCRHQQMRLRSRFADAMKREATNARRNQRRRRSRIVSADRTSGGMKRGQGVDDSNAVERCCRENF
jgi:hypothetical protein